LEDSDIYRAAEGLAQYIHEKDESKHPSQLYRRIIENIDNVGIEQALLRPLYTFKAMEAQSNLKGNLDRILVGLGENPKPFVPKKDISIVASASDACIAKCIEDVLEGAEKGAKIGGAVGMGGGVATGAAGAAAGGVIGGSLGGVKCSVSEECKGGKASDNKFVVPANYDIDRIRSIDVGQYLKNSRRIVVNNGPRSAGIN
jgi:hypothetical protein